jgi:hypothetical protein
MRDLFKRDLKNNAHSPVILSAAKDTTDFSQLTKLVP